MGPKQLDDKMMSLEDALQLIKKIVELPKTKKMKLNDSVGCVLAEAVTSDINIPPFDKAAMDGFACRSIDLPGPLKVIETIPAGSFPVKKLGERECARIMTGAPVPEGADTVIMIEYIEELPDGRIRFLREKSRANICMLGEDVKKNELILSAGTVIGPEHIAVLAGAGKSTVLTYCKPRIAVLPTGNELVEPDTRPEKGQIRNSNGHQLLAQLGNMGLPVYYSGIVNDDKKSLEKALNNALENADVLIFSGGVSVGDYDYVPDVLAEAGFKTHITKMAMKPGKHTLFATRKGKYVLGIPGNPASSFVQMEIVGKFFLKLLMGNLYTPLRMKIDLADNYRRRKSDRFELVPVSINDKGAAKLLEYHGSAHIHALAKADVLMEIPIDVTEIKAGEKVYVRPF